MKRIIDFNEEWYFAREEGKEEEQVTIPHTWNAADGQDGGNDYYRGTCFYTKEFEKPQMYPGERAYLEFQGAAMTAVVKVNRRELCRHEGGFSSFYVDITDVLQEKNRITVAVDNSANNRVYPQKADFTFYGGIYREVRLLVVPEKHFKIAGDQWGVKVTPQVDGRKAELVMESWQNYDGQVRFSLYAPAGCGREYWQGKREQENGKCICTVAARSVNGYAKAGLTLDNARLWDGLEDPYLYQVKVELLENEVPVDYRLVRFGCRCFSFDRERGFFLNGRSYPLRGVSRHQDRKGVGNALTGQMMDEDMDLLRELGANTIRLAHYQHSQYFYDLCDEEGLAVWAEIPYISWHMTEGRENTLAQMRELVVQCYHHPGIICWGLSNEITVSGSVTEELIENHRELNDLCHQLDFTRPTTMAHVFMLEKDSPMTRIADIGSYNLYYGWYVGEVEDNGVFFDEYHQRYPERVIGLSEYGADANPAFHSAVPEKGDYSEEYQCIYHEALLKCIEERPYLWATHLWNLFDFAADGREEGGQHGVNQKGLITFDRKLKKDAFYLYKAYWSREPFVHLCGRRYAKRSEDQTQIKVYSNLPKVALYMDGQLVEEQAGKYVFVFQVRLTEKHVVAAKAVCGSASDRTAYVEKESCTGADMQEKSICEDSMELQKVDVPNPSYRMGKIREVSNWFDEEALDPACFSIQDTIGNIMEVPAGKAIVDRFIQKGRAARGEVAEASADNPVLQKMLARMTMQNLLKQVADIISEEEIQGLNKALQQIRKPVKKEQGYTEDYPLTPDAAIVEEPHRQQAIYPGRPWRDTDGKRIQTHGGALFYENGIYYWYGENKDRTDGRNPVWTWGIRAYESTDLYNWKDIGLIIPPNLQDKESGLYPEKRVDRPHIIKCEATQKYVCWIKLSGEEACFLILQADAFTGPYRIVQENYRPEGRKIGDFDLFVEEDGRAYLFVEADHEGVYGYELTENYLSTARLISTQYKGLHAPFSREAVALFERNGKKYMLTSGMSGYLPNKSDIAVSDSFSESFVSVGNPHLEDASNASFNSQISQVFRVPGKKDLYIAIADRWVPGYPVDARKADIIERSIAAHYEPDKYQVSPKERRELMNSPMLENANTSIADYVWLPLSFKGDQVQIAWREQWTIEEYE